MYLSQGHVAYSLRKHRICSFELTLFNRCKTQPPALEIISDLCHGHIRKLWDKYGCIMCSIEIGATCTNNLSILLFLRAMRRVNIDCIRSSVSTRHVKWGCLASQQYVHFSEGQLLKKNENRHSFMKKKPVFWAGTADSGAELIVSLCLQCRSASLGTI